jgi:hypothetical protein
VALERPVDAQFLAVKHLGLQVLQRQVGAAPVDKLDKAVAGALPRVFVLEREEKRGGEGVL